MIIVGDIGAESKVCKRDKGMMRKTTLQFFVVSLLLFQFDVPLRAAESKPSWQATWDKNRRAGARDQVWADAVSDVRNAHHRCRSPDHWASLRMSRYNLEQ